MVRGVDQLWLNSKPLTDEKLAVASTVYTIVAVSPDTNVVFGEPALSSKDMVKSGAGVWATRVAEEVVPVPTELLRALDVML